MYGRECAFHFSAEAKPTLACTNRFVMLIEIASVLYFNNGRGLFWFTSVIYTLMVSQHFPWNMCRSECTFHFRAEAKPTLACTNRFVMLIEIASVLYFNNGSGLFWFTSVIYTLMVSQHFPWNMCRSECTFHFRAEAKPTLACTNRFVMLTEIASVLYFNNASGLFCFTSVIYTLMVSQLFPLRMYGRECTFHFRAEAKPMLATMNR